MPALYNKKSREELEKILDKTVHNRTVLSFYKYYHLGNPQIFRDHLYILLQEIDVLGRIYVSYEGINGQISVPEEKVEELRQAFNQINFLEGVRFNFAIEHEKKSFLKLKIKVRNKIVADGLDDTSFDVTNKGVHLDAIRFNELADDENTIIVDMRNHYESEIGYFKNAILPDADSFREALKVVENELQDQKEKNIVMYCTGGIRCEKASAYYKHIGFKNVFQLDGGIIEYARRVRELGIENKFIGKNFVFDARLGERISEDIISRCHQCGAPCDNHTNCANEACHLLFIQCDSCKNKYQNTCCTECHEIIQLPIEEQKELRKGKINKNRYFKKGRSKALKYRKISGNLIGEKNL